MPKPNPKKKSKVAPKSARPGKDHTWVLLRGLGAHEGQWGNFENEFREFMPQAEILHLSLSGNGPRVHEESHFSMRQNVEDLRTRLFHRLRPGARFHFVGTSMGAMAGVEWYQRYPEDFLSMTCIGTSDGSQSPFYHRVQIQNIRGVLALADSSQGMNTKVSNLVKQAIAAHFHTFPSEPPDVPTLLLVSAEDKFTHPDCTLRVGAKWAIEPHVHPTAGHDLPVEDPRWVAKKIHQFWEMHFK